MGRTTATEVITPSGVNWGTTTATTINLPIFIDQ